MPVINRKSQIEKPKSRLELAAPTLGDILRNQPVEKSKDKFMMTERISLNSLDESVFCKIVSHHGDLDIDPNTPRTNGSASSIQDDVAVKGSLAKKLN
jgi:uncharacterized protein involved in propanediol utilization